MELFITKYLELRKIQKQDRGTYKWLLRNINYPKKVDELKYLFARDLGFIISFTGIIFFLTFIFL